MATLIQKPFRSGAFAVVRATFVPPLAALALLCACGGAEPEREDDETTSTAISTQGSLFVPVQPSRAFDSRGPQGTWARVNHGEIEAVCFSLPGDATAVAINLTVTDGLGPGYLTAFPFGTTMPIASNVNYVAGQTVANAAVVPLGPQNRCIDVYNYGGPVHIIVDLTGYFSAAGGKHMLPVTPVRVLDTREYSSYGIAGGTTKTLLLSDPKKGVPNGISGAFVNLTSVDPPAPGYLTVWASGQKKPDSSNLNFTPGATVANATFTPTNGSGQIDMFAYSTSHIIADVLAVMSDAGGNDGYFLPVSPYRALDTRSNFHLQFGPQQSRPVQIVQGPVPGAMDQGPVGAALVNVTVVPGSWAGYATAGAPSGIASTLNFRPGQVVANLAVVQLSAEGSTNVFNGSNAPIDVIVDVLGVISGPPASPDETLPTGTAYEKTGRVLHNCGNITCSLYFSRSLTQKISGGLDVFSDVCSGLHEALQGLPYAEAAVSVCSAVASSLSFFGSQASQHNACLKITYLPGIMLPTWISSNQGQYCVD